MKLIFMTFLVTLLGCQTQKKESVNTKNTSAVIQEEKVKPNNDKETDILCDMDVCLQLRNHNISNKSFDIYMLNAVPVAGFQCDFPGINIISSDGGLLKENEYQTSNSTNRILSFSMQAKLIPVGKGVLTTIIYSELIEEICMTEIIFAGIGGKQLSNNAPSCMQLN
jgi:hypothetical protein